MECPNCHAHNRPEAKFCQTCGAILLTDAPISSYGRGQTPPPAQGNKQPHQADLPVTAPLSTRVDSFKPLPVGALLDKGRYVVWETLTTDENVNTYLVEDLIPIRQCTNCSNLERSANTRVCVLCGTDLSTAQAVTLRYIAEEWLHQQTFNAEQHLMEINIQYLGLYLPHAVFTEKPYVQERDYRVSPELSLMLASSLSGLQELPTVLAWGEMLAEALDILHSQFINPFRISLEDIVIENNRAAWTNINQATLMSQASRSTARKIFQTNVRDLAGILWYLATGQYRITKTPSIPDALYSLFSKANKGSISAKALAIELHTKLEELRRPESITLAIGHRTDVGRTRSLNEDSLITLDYAAVYRSLCIPVGIFVVADGMGGHAAGDIASRLTCQVLAKRIANDLMVPATDGELPTNTSVWLTDAIRDANQAVFDERQTAHSDMGNTLVATLLIGNAATIANVGDSRCYHLTHGGIRQITTDHSLVERLIETGQITREEAAVHPQKNVIYRVIGDKPEVDVDIFEQNLNLDEALLLCSDGLSGMVKDSHIFKLWQSSKSPQEACDRLVEAANQAGGEDNITVVIVQLLP